MILIPGAFNPITNAHIQIGIELQKRYPEEQIVYIPSSHDYIAKYKRYYEEDIIPDKDREMLLEQSIQPYDFTWSFIEIRGVVSGYAIDTLDYMKDCVKEDVYYVIGTDQLSNLLNWYQGERLVKENKFIVFIRKGYEDFSEYYFNNLLDYQHNFTFINADITSISSSMVRYHVKMDYLDIAKNLVPECVYNYYKEKQCLK